MFSCENLIHISYEHGGSMAVMQPACKARNKIASYHLFPLLEETFL